MKILREHAAAPPAAPANTARALPVWICVEVARGNAAVVVAWLLGGGSVNALEAVTRTTLLIFASKNGREQVVELLLANGAAFDLQSGCGTTALIAASKSGHDRVVELLLVAGAATDLRTDEEGTALMYASIGGHVNVVRRLQRAGARDDLLDAEAMSALAAAQVELKKLVAPPRPGGEPEAQTSRGRIRRLRREQRREARADTD